MQFNQTPKTKYKEFEYDGDLIERILRMKSEQDTIYRYDDPRRLEERSQITFTPEEAEVFANM